MLQGAKLIAFDDIRVDLSAEADSIIRQELESSERAEHPRMIHMCGIPGSGKTTYTTAWMKKDNSFAVVQFDNVLECLSGYRKDRDELGPVEAFTRWELPARAIGYHCLQALVESRRDILFDHSATSPLHIELIERVKGYGYYVEMHYIECDPAEALRRIRLREEAIRRHTPEQLVYERAEILRDLLPTYKKIVDRFVPVEFTK